ncbi:DUF2490 domain-containing protein [Sediminibacterium sp.]|uniref:DUF2490 domain-containing protein n=1 Tax=Sediminibacterium sp. TaxID=1917865 RepID=UPI003F6E8EDE
MVPLHINLKKALILIGAFLYSTLLFSQTPGLGTWNVLTGRFNYNSKWHGFVELQLRSQQTYDHFNYHEVKGGIGYMITPSLSALVGTGRYVTYQVNDNFKLPFLVSENRIWQQLIYNQTFPSLRIEHRLRAEQRYTSAGYRNRFRYRLSAVIPINKKTITNKTFFLNTSNEFHFNNENVFYEQNRFYLGGGYNFSNKLSLQMGWIYRSDFFSQNRAQYKNFLQTSLQFTFSKSKSTAIRNIGSVD